jgi:hypothetical protein
MYLNKGRVSGYNKNNHYKEADKQQAFYLYWRSLQEESNSAWHKNYTHMTSTRHFYEWNIYCDLRTITAHLIGIHGNYFTTFTAPQILNRRCQYPRGLRRRSLKRHECLSPLNVVCCQVEISGTGWSLVQRSPTECVCVSPSVIRCNNKPSAPTIFT